MTEIIDRGRGPEIAGTRITVYRIMDFLRDGEPAAAIAAQLELRLDQVQAALDYIEANRTRVEAEYAKILRRVQQPNPAWVQSILAKSPEELRERIVARHGVAAPGEPRET